MTLCGQLPKPAKATLAPPIPDSLTTSNRTASSDTTGVTLSAGLVEVTTNVGPVLDPGGAVAGAAGGAVAGAAGGADVHAARATPSRTMPTSKGFMTSCAVPVDQVAGSDQAAARAAAARRRRLTHFQSSTATSANELTARAIASSIALSGWVRKIRCKNGT